MGRHVAESMATAAAVRLETGLELCRGSNLAGLLEDDEDLVGDGVAYPTGDGAMAMAHGEDWGGTPRGRRRDGAAVDAAASAADRLEWVAGKTHGRGIRMSVSIPGCTPLTRGAAGRASSLTRGSQITRSRHSRTLTREAVLQQLLKPSACASAPSRWAEDLSGPVRGKAWRKWRMNIRRHVQKRMELGAPESLMDVVHSRIEFHSWIQSCDRSREGLSETDLSIVLRVLRARCAVLWPHLIGCRTEALRGRKRPGGPPAPVSTENAEMSATEMDYVFALLTVVYRSVAGIPIPSSVAATATVTGGRAPSTSSVQDWALSPIPRLGLALPPERLVGNIELQDGQCVVMGAFTRYQGMATMWTISFVERLVKTGSDPDVRRLLCSPVREIRDFEAILAHQRPEFTGRE
jgi:hypothetical protein